MVRSFVCTALLCYRIDYIKKIKALDDYIYIDVYLFEVFVYLHFKANIYTLLVRDLKHTCTLNTHTIRCYLARFHDWKWSVRNFVEKKIFFINEQNAFLVINQNVNVSGRVLSKIQSSLNQALFLFTFVRFKHTCK